MRKVHIALLAVVALLAGFFVAAPASNAANVTFVEGLLNGRFGAYQAFDVSRVPPLPTCTGTTPNSFKVTVSTALFGAPASGASGRAVDLANRYLTFFESGDADYPWGIRMYQSTDNKELRFNGTDWVTDSDAGFAAGKPFSVGGNIVAADEKGFLHISKETGVTWSGGYGTFISITTPRSPGDVITYTPSADMNDCTTFKTPIRTDQGGDDTNTGPVIKLSTTKTIYVPDNPLGPPTDDATIKALTPSVGEIEGQVKPDVLSYNWGVATAGTNSLYVKVFPTNSGATITYGDKLYRSGQPIGPLSIDPETPLNMTLKITSVDETKTQDYSIKVTAYPTNVMPTVEEIAPTSASSKGGSLLKITGKGFSFAKSIVFTPNGDIYSDLAISAKKVILNLKHPKLLPGEFRLINNRTIEVVNPAAPDGKGGFYTGEYFVIVDTPFANSSQTGASRTDVVTLLQPQKPKAKLNWAKKLLVPGVTKLLGLPIKMNSGQPAKIKVLVRFFGRSKSAGDVSTYSIIRKSDGVYIDMKTTQKALVTTVVTAKGTKKYAPYYAAKALTTK